jgi:uncharacterized protein YjlB
MRKLLPLLILCIFMGYMCASSLDYMHYSYDNHYGFSILVGEETVIGVEIMGKPGVFIFVGEGDNLLAPISNTDGL